MVALRYLLDTNVLSEGTYLRPNPNVVDRIVDLAEQLATGAPVVHEMTFGYLKLPPSRQRQRIEDYINRTIRGRLPILPYDQAAAEWHAAERARLVALDRTPPFVDGQIAAISATNGLILVTANVADFQNFQGLHVEDWRVASTNHG